MSGDKRRMRHAAFAALALLAAPATAAERNYSVTSFDRVRVDGPYQVTVKTNVAPFARASGSQASLDGVSIKVEGRTLVVRSDSSGGWGGYPGEGRGPVTIDVGTHELANAWINGPGALFIDKVKGLSFDLAIQGSGVARIDAVDVDQLRLGISGAASSRVAGRALKLTATVRGSSSLDAEALAVRKRGAYASRCWMPGDDSNWFIEHVATRPDYRGRSLTASLFAHVLDEGRAAGHAKASITFYIGNDPA